MNDLFQRLQQVIPSEEWVVVEPLLREIHHLREDRDAVVLAHRYMAPEIYHGIADCQGDWWGLAEAASQVDSEVIVVAGVRFIADLVKTVAPAKTVLVPDPLAGCSLAEGVTGTDVRVLRGRYPGVPVVTSVEVPVDVIAESDGCCTVENAVAVVESFGADQVIFLPDRHLAGWVAVQTDTTIIPWNASCVVHERFGVAEVEEYRSIHPGIEVLAHPACPAETRAEADHVGSTGAMIDWVESRQPAQAVMITECSLSDNLAVDHPGTGFVRTYNLCPYMQRITLRSIRDTLLTMQPQATVTPQVAERARRVIDRMREVRVP